MRMPLFAWVALSLGAVAVTCRADENPEIVSLGHDTYALTRWANNGFTRNLDKLKAAALDDAAAYCARLHKELKVVSTTAHRPLVPLTGFASAKVVFKALDANSPELRTAAAAPAAGAEMPAATPAAAPEAAAPPTSTDQLYSDLMKLDDLRKRGILTDQEFEALKKKLLDKAN